MDILRFITAGNIDDGKSTLTGRLLLDTGNIKADVLDSVSSGAVNEINLAHIADGLRSEREQGITIDVAYKYLNTPGRKFIITDAPGHFQYTRNLVTGASNADAMIILVDACNGVTDQTKRHSMVAAFLGIGHVLVAVNKMDAVGFDQNVFNVIAKEYRLIADKLSLGNVTIVPVSALLGDNVSFHSEKMSWYDGATVLSYLEQIGPYSTNFGELRYALQCTTNVNGNKLFGGRLLSGKLVKGQLVKVWPGQKSSKISAIFKGFDEVEEATQGDSVNLRLDTDNGVDRGCMITSPDTSVKNANEIKARICWLDEKEELKLDAAYLFRMGSLEIACRVTNVLSVMDINSLAPSTPVAQASVNQFADVVIAASEEMIFDLYHIFRSNGRAILIDPVSNDTVAAVIITDAL